MEYYVNMMWHRAARHKEHFSPARNTRYTKLSYMYRVRLYRLCGYGSFIQKPYSYATTSLNGCYITISIMWQINCGRTMSYFSLRWSLITGSVHFTVSCMIRSHNLCLLSKLKQSSHGVGRHHWMTRNLFIFGFNMGKKINPWTTCNSSYIGTEIRDKNLIQILRFRAFKLGNSYVNW